jgi:hypothetical protein
MSKPNTTTGEHSGGSHCSHIYVVEVQVIDPIAKQTKWLEIARYADKGPAYWCSRANNHCKARIRQEVA